MSAPDVPVTSFELVTYACLGLMLAALVLIVTWLIWPLMTGRPADLEDRTRPIHPKPWEGPVQPHVQPPVQQAVQPPRAPVAGRAPVWPTPEQRAATQRAQQAGDERLRRVLHKRGHRRIDPNTGRHHRP